MTEIWQKIYRLWACDVHCICHFLSLSTDKCKWTRMWGYSLQTDQSLKTTWNDTHQLSYQIPLFCSKDSFPKKKLYIFIQYFHEYNKTRKKKKTTKFTELIQYVLLWHFLCCFWLLHGIRYWISYKKNPSTMNQLPLVLPGCSNFIANLWYTTTNYCTLKFFSECSCS